MAKITIEQVRESVEEQGWELVSDKYVNLKTDLELLCPQGHSVNIPYGDWRDQRTHICPICSHQPFIKINEKPKRKSGYRILAFDQASITSGWAIFDNDKLINYGHWSSNGQHSTQRISLTKAWFISMIEAHKPDEVILEDIQLQKGDFGENVLTFKKLAHLQGVLKNYLYEHGILYRVIPAATWRNYSNVKGKTRTDRKRSAQLIVQKLYDINVTQDEADSILLARCAAADHGETQTIRFL